MKYIIVIILVALMGCSHMEVLNDSELKKIITIQDLEGVYHRYNPAEFSPIPWGYGAVLIEAYCYSHKEFEVSIIHKSGRIESK
jgi:hypothetical protein|tara:strand:- start:310 stop:561 length:252 start_codon:yes stop_codon:yes gene_type:complete